MIGLLVPLRWWRGTGTPTYSEAPQRRYVWAPPDPHESTVAPGPDPASVLPQPGIAIVAAVPTISVVHPLSTAVVPPFAPLSIA